MQSVQDKIVEKLQLLPEADLNQVLNFVESTIHQRHANEWGKK